MWRAIGHRSSPQVGKLNRPMSLSKGRIVGYARERRGLSGVDKQLVTLRAEGCETIFVDLRTHRSQHELEKMFGYIESGDLVVVTNLDQIAGSLFELHAYLKRITERGCQIRSLAEPWIDSSSATGDMAFTILEALSNLDRNFKRIAAANGRLESKFKGTHLGRNCKLTPSQQLEVVARREAGESPAAIARSYGISRTTVVRLLRQQ